ncbi:MAG: MobC family plasmid mobilization relaxosome protein [Dysgonamonadaceae bacterium]|jgi:hypothetical protein|nr:MobC family plasmid mobilization relaxosome protein [Dysgonamonadaceae bacterium]
MKTIKNQNKNGRPKKAEADKKKYKLTLKMETKEYFSFKAKVHLSGLCQSEYIRLCIEKSEVKQRLSPEHLGYIRQLSGMANNINQIAKRANAAGYLETHKEYRNVIEQIDNIVKYIME